MEMSKLWVGTLCFFLFVIGPLTWALWQSFRSHPTRPRQNRYWRIAKIFWWRIKRGVSPVWNKVCNLAVWKRCRTHYPPFTLVLLAILGIWKFWDKSLPNNNPSPSERWVWPVVFGTIAVGLILALIFVKRKGVASGGSVAWKKLQEGFKALGDKIGHNILGLITFAFILVAFMEFAPKKWLAFCADHILLSILAISLITLCLWNAQKGSGGTAVASGGYGGGWLKTASLAAGIFALLMVGIFFLHVTIGFRAMASKPVMETGTKPQDDLLVEPGKWTTVSGHFGVTTSWKILDIEEKVWVWIPPMEPYLDRAGYHNPKIPKSGGFEIRFKAEKEPVHIRITRR